MAKNNNLTDFLTDVANAIREKKGSSDPINPQNFSDEIASIESGGGGGGGGADVIFRDYDGAILHSFSADEFLAMSEMPTLPSQQGLICQGWNYTLQDAQEYVAEYGVLDVGATYITADNKTRLHIKVDGARRLFNFKVSINKSNSLTVNWGDGTNESISGSGSVSLSHRYGAIGDYVISFNVASEATLSFVGSSQESFINAPYTIMLRKVELGENVSIGMGAFYGCRSLASVVIPNSVTTISEKTFYNCFSLASVVIPNSVTSIGNYAFNACYSLTSVVIPKGVTSMGSSAFFYCYSLASVVIPNGMSNVSYNAFNACRSLASVAIPNSVTSIVESAFNSCVSLTSVVIPNSVKTIGSSAFYGCSALTSVVIPNSVTTIGGSAFYGCYSLTSVVISNGVTTISEKAFYSCYALSSVVIPNSVTSIGSSAFYTCYSLASVVIPNSVKTIGNDAFYYCSALTSVVIPNSVTSIGSGAFRYCEYISLFDFRDHTSVPTLSSYTAFNNLASDRKIVVPDSLYDTWIAATNWSNSTVANYIVKASEFNA